MGVWAPGGPDNVPYNYAVSLHSPPTLFLPDRQTFPLPFPWATAAAEAGHAQFADAGCVINAGADLMCGKGRAKRPAVATLATTPLLAWLWEQMEGQVSGEAWALCQAEARHLARLCFLDT